MTTRRHFIAGLLAAAAAPAYPAQPAPVFVGRQFWDNRPGPDLALTEASLVRWSNVEDPTVWAAMPAWHQDLFTSFRKVKGWAP